MSLNIRICLGFSMPRKSSYFLWFAIPILTTLSQACMKLLAIQMKNIPFSWQWLGQAIGTPWTLGILGCETVSFVLWLTILSETSVSKATPITAISYILILGMSWTLFKEPIMPLQIIGSIFILAGVWLIGTASSNTVNGELL